MFDFTISRLELQKRLPVPLAPVASTHAWHVHCAPCQLITRV